MKGVFEVFFLFSSTHFVRGEFSPKQEWPGDKNVAGAFQDHRVIIQPNAN